MRMVLNCITPSTQTLRQLYALFWHGTYMEGKPPLRVEWMYTPEEWDEDG